MTWLDLMLVLSRKVGQRILIGDQITVTIVRVGQGGVRIGIEAPADVAVVREELISGNGPLRSNRKEKQSAARAAKTESNQSLASSRSLATPTATDPSGPSSESSDSGESPRVLPR